MLRRTAVLVALAATTASCARGDSDVGTAQPAAAPTSVAPSTTAGPTNTATVAAGTSATATTGAAPNAAAPAALQFSAPLVGGGQIDMTTLADKPVLLWFWAPY